MTANEAALADRKNNPNKEAKNQGKNRKNQNKTEESAVKILGIQGQRLAKIIDAAVNQNKQRVQNPSLENLAKTLRKLLEELKKFNQNVEKNRLEGEGDQEKIREGRVLPPILRSLQLLLQRPEAKIVLRAKSSPGILVETQDLERGGRRLKFGTVNAAVPAENQNDSKPKIDANLPEDSVIRCQILRQFGIMWLAPFCHRNPGRFDFSRFSI